MTELETRLTEGLRGTADHAPHPGDLAAGARDRLRRRRRTTAGVVATALAVVAVPVAVTVAGDGGEPDHRDPTATDPALADWRVESFRDLTLRVPPEWGYDGGPDWCADGQTLAEATPAVTRQESFRADVRCTPRLGYGVIFGEGRGLPGDAPYGTPEGAVLDLVRASEAYAWVVAESSEQLERIVASAGTIDDVDANGCPPVVEPEAEAAGERVSVCRYDSGQLEQSRLLSPEDSQVLARAVASAPPVATDPACAPYSHEQPIVTMKSADVDARLLPGETCTIATVFLTGPGHERLLTEDVLRWALPPDRSGSFLTY